MKYRLANGFLILTSVIVVWVEANVQTLGSIQLDSLSINKTLLAFPVTLLKIDTAFPSGEKHNVWTELANELSETDDICVAEVRVKDFGDMINEDLAQRFKVTKEMYPEVLLFIRTKENEGKSWREVRYGGEFTLNAIKSFIKHKTGYTITLPGCLKRYDELAHWFMSKSDNEHQGKVIEKAEKELDKLSAIEQSKAKKYIKVMKAIVNDGEGAIKKEDDRLRKLIVSDKMSPQKRRELNKNLNILKSFKDDSVDIKKKDEL